MFGEGKNFAGMRSFEEGDAVWLRLRTRSSSRGIPLAENSWQLVRGEREVREEVREEVRLSPVDSEITQVVHSQAC